MEKGKEKIIVKTFLHLNGTYNGRLNALFSHPNLGELQIVIRFFLSDNDRKVGSWKEVLNNASYGRLLSSEFH